MDEQSSRPPLDVATVGVPSIAARNLCSEQITRSIFSEPHPPLLGAPIATSYPVEVPPQLPQGKTLLLLRSKRGIFGYEKQSVHREIPTTSKGTPA